MFLLCSRGPKWILFFKNQIKEIRARKTLREYNENA